MKAEFCYVVFNLDLEMRYIFTGSSGIPDEVKQWSKFLELRWPVSSDHCTADPEILHLVDGYRCHIHITLSINLDSDHTSVIIPCQVLGSGSYTWKYQNGFRFVSICISTEGQFSFHIQTFWQDVGNVGWIVHSHQATPFHQHSIFLFDWYLFRQTKSC